MVDTLVHTCFLSCVLFVYFICLLAARTVTLVQWEKKKKPSDRLVGEITIEAYHGFVRRKPSRVLILTERQKFMLYRISYKYMHVCIRWKWRAHRSFVIDRHTDQIHRTHAHNHKPFERRRKKKWRKKNNSKSLESFGKHSNGNWNLGNLFVVVVFLLLLFCFISRHQYKCKACYIAHIKQCCGHWQHTFTLTVCGKYEWTFH